MIILFDTHTIVRDISDTYSSGPLVLYFAWMYDSINRMFRARALISN